MTDNHEVDPQDDQSTDPVGLDGTEADGNEPAPAAAQVAQLEEKLRRVMADLANFRKRQARELQDARRNAIEGVTGELLPVLDNFYLALQAHEQHVAKDGDPAVSAAQDEGQALIEGVKMVRSLLVGVLERHGLAEIEAADRQFDPMHHEAVGIDPTSALAAGHITQVVQRGYRLGDKILRASRVLVSGSADPAPGDHPTD